MSKILKMLIGLLALGATACTSEDDFLQPQEQENVMQVPMFSRAALAPSATVVGLDEQGNKKFTWNLTDSEPDVENNFWTSSDASPSLNGVSDIACLVPSSSVGSDGTVGIRPNADDVLQWGKVSVSDKAGDNRYYINLDYKLATICVELDFSRSSIYAYYKPGGTFDVQTGEFTSLYYNIWNYVSLKEVDGKYMATFSVVPQKFTKGTDLLEYASTTYTHTFKADKDYDLKAGQTLHIHAYQDNDGWSSYKNTINVSSVTLNQESVDMVVGDAEKGTFQLTATIAPSNATNKNITWSSSDTGIATVSNDGLVTAVASGVATVTAKSHNGKTATCQIIVASTIEDWEEGGTGSGTLTPQ